MRVVIVQYAGDYREAVERIASSGEETYYAQKYSVDAVTPRALNCDSVTVICCLTKTPYEEMLQNGVRAIGLGFSGTFEERALIPLLAREKPDRLILRTPAMHILKWAISQAFYTVASLADSFSSKGLRGYIRSSQWAKLLNNERIEWVFNHGLNSCLSLKKIGVNPDKIVPWDWPALVTPAPEVRSLRSQAPYKLLYVGMVSEAKGIGDVVRAVALLAGSNLDVTLKVVGGGEIDSFTTLARTLHVENRVEFLGLLPHGKVIEELRNADVVVVPSRHEYNEGLPMTIYETLCARTPIVASDHPMFRANLTHNTDALIFPAGDVSALAAAITKVLTDANLYHRLSSASAHSWQQLQLPVKWAESLQRWLSASPDDKKWLFDHRLSSGIYPLHRYEQ